MTTPEPFAVTSEPGLFALSIVLLAAACTQPALKPNPHYFLGDPYKVGSFWYYPQENFDLEETGIAATIRNGTTRLTTDGEVFDQGSLAAAHPTIQLPAIARLTNLESGREVTVRLNDRGSGNPHRLVEITRRTAELLGIRAGDVARVRLRILPKESHAAAEAVPGAPLLALIAAPRGGVQITDLPPPPGVRQDNRRAVPFRAVVAREPTPTAAPLMRLPETVVQTLPQAGKLMVRLDTFDDYQYAAFQRARMAWSGAYIISVFEGRTERFRVEVGPLPNVAAADALLDKAFASGIPDARIVVD